MKTTPAGSGRGTGQGQRVQLQASESQEDGRLPIWSPKAALVQKHLAMSGQEALSVEEREHVRRRRLLKGASDSQLRTKNLMDNAVFLAIALASIVLGSSGSNPSGCGLERSRVFQLLSRAREKIEQGGAKWNNSSKPAWRSRRQRSHSPSTCTSSAKSIPPSATS